ncbi:MULTISPECIES: response regulator [unclassified Methylobacterium]|uniref:response regulator transcription factor n=1 Tax=unclassified Methylobacterium TaxID=2615210 RepID=UPI000A9B264B|nr:MULTISPECIES: response regulator [unclassified Methylobacterium]MCK2053076.1 response regulator [Methylobacterium sp. 37f]
MTEIAREFPAQTPIVAIVDDDPAIRAALARLTRALGYAPAPFAGAEPLLRAGPFSPEADGSTIAVVITDVQMPGLSGLDLLRILHTRHPALPVIVMTAYPSEANRARALASGAFAYLAKPFDAEQFEGCLRSVLGGAPMS